MAGRRPTRADEVPEADALEQATSLAGDDGARTDLDAMAPDAPSFEVEPSAAPAVGELPADVPEADALEQATPAGDDDDWHDREQ
jgi:hypothetical protein